jgi:hypothetical protein
MYPSLYSRAHSFILSPGLVNKPKWSVIKEKIALAQLVVDERTLVIGKWYARGQRAEGRGRLRIANFGLRISDCGFCNEEEAAGRRQRRCWRLASGPVGPMARREV